MLILFKEVVKKSGNTIVNARIKLDGSGDRKFRKNFFTYIKREVNNTSSNPVCSCKMVNSKNNVLVQLADMVAGSINRSYNSYKKDSYIYKQIIKNKIEDEWQFE